jgi:multicomponent Na+:H+ antiporter subunit E
VIVTATIVSLTLFPSPRWRWRFSSFVRFIPFFLWQSLRGGVDVARLAFHPQLPLAPLLLDYHLRLPEGPAQVFLADLVSLLPGTLSADLQQGCLTVHAIAGDSTSLSQELQSLENRTAELYRVNLSAPQT